MSATRLPLPLELTEPVLLIGDLDTQIRAAVYAGQYDPKTQLCDGSQAQSQTVSQQECRSDAGCGSLDLTIDTQMDDVAADIV